MSEAIPARYIAFKSPRQFYLCLTLVEAMQRRKETGALVYESLGMTAAIRIAAEPDATERWGAIAPVSVWSQAAIEHALPRLIDLAPDLYRLCSDALEYLTPRRARNPEADALCERLSQALAKATGAQS